MTLQVQTGTQNEILRTKSKPVRQVNGELRHFALDMIKTMEAEKGVGLAAPQVGRNIRMIVCKLNPGEHNEVVVPMINPEILSESKAKQMGEEGCLSLPGDWGQVERSKSILLRFMNLKGKQQTLELSDFNAVVVQHEIDHLNGVLFTDHVKELKHASASGGRHI